MFKSLFKPSLFQTFSTIFYFIFYDDAKDDVWLIWSLNIKYILLLTLRSGFLFYKATVKVKIVPGAAIQKEGWAISPDAKLYPKACFGQLNKMIRKKKKIYTLETRSFLKYDWECKKPEREIILRRSIFLYYVIKISIGLIWRTGNS